MENKKKLLILGVITLLVFPIPAFLIQYFWFNKTPISLLNFDSFTFYNISLGFVFGSIYAFVITKISEIKSISIHFTDQKEMLLDFDLRWWEYLFLSLCAGIGEELLFRLGVQPFFGIWPTSFFFVAIHGYFSFKNVDDNLPGALLMPFIAAIAIGYGYFGIWFCIAAHFAYDFVIFHMLLWKKTS